jgi:hypothetical protein
MVCGCPNGQGFAVGLRPPACPQMSASCTRAAREWSARPGQPQPAESGSSMCFGRELYHLVDSAWRIRWSRVLCQAASRPSGSMSRIAAISGSRSALMRRAPRSIIDQVVVGIPSKRARSDCVYPAC